MSYYHDKLPSLRTLFGQDDIRIENDMLVVGNKQFPIIDDVIILSAPGAYSDFVRRKLNEREKTGETVQHFAEDIQYTFGKEWEAYSEILPEHAKEFEEYFDIVDRTKLTNARVADVGCGNGRWAYYLKDTVKELVLLDFSDAIFVARKNLKDKSNCLFFMVDLRHIPFKNDAFDFLYCIGVLHHLPTPCLDEVRALARFAPQLLIYLYYALDNRPWYFRWILKVVTMVRLIVSRVRSEFFRRIFSSLGTIFIYYPFIILGAVLCPLGLARFVPLYEAYHDKGFKRIEQDVYDRFFTRIEQRVSEKDIMMLTDTFRDVQISPQKPFWHFLCKR